MMPSRETAFIIFSAICVVYIIWMDVRPHLRSLLKINGKEVLWERYHEGVKLRNRGANTVEYDAWCQEFESWRNLVWQAAESVSPALKNDLMTMNMVPQHYRVQTPETIEHVRRLNVIS